MPREVLFEVKNTRFITFGQGHMTNLQGDPERDGNFGSNSRRADILLSPEDCVRFDAEGIPYRHLDADPEKGYDELNFIQANVYDNEYYPAKVYIQIGETPSRLLPVEDYGLIDEANDHNEVINVSATVRPFVNKKGTWSYAIRVMHVDMIDANTDPFARPVASPAPQDE